MLCYNEFGDIMNGRNEILNKYYNEKCDEDSRLIKNQTHKLEFIVTTTYIDKYLKSGDKVLEIGAGTGRYSIHYANLGYDVTSIEYVEHNLDILKSKITDDMKIVAEQGDAVDLSRFADNTFDSRFCFINVVFCRFGRDANQVLVSHCVACDFVTFV